MPNVIGEYDDKLQEIITGGVLLFLLSVKVGDQFLRVPAGECLIKTWGFFLFC